MKKKELINSAEIIPANEFKTINIRMLNKAIYDADGCLKEAAVNLNSEMYYPKLDKDFKITKVTRSAGGVEVHAEAIRHLKEFSLSIH
ncbi:hypothetical protein [Domibacillus epiphyticus]|uniref:Uncharacterized protein n=1 Tax=Domibacillus epiphyticus TaxID=1714355 RepID=A0A1V2ACL5_9BACI|nr:hypothetical protein [Domibacillus epiphyticus]OMP68690.1 hypothetical protein BTO28_01175 [Domibacillus epiphyticus]